MNDPAATNTGPGFLAFVAFFVLALVLWFLMRNMNSRMRRMSYRQQAAHRGNDEPQATEADLEAEDQARLGAAPADQQASGRALPEGEQGEDSSDPMPGDSGNADAENTDTNTVTEPADTQPADAENPEATEDPRRQGGEPA